MSLVPGHHVTRSFLAIPLGASLFWLLINYHVAAHFFIYWPVALVARFGDSPGFRGIGQDQHQASGRRRSLSPRSTCDTFQKVLLISPKSTCNKGYRLALLLRWFKLTLNSLSVLSSRQAALEREIKCQIGRRVRWCRCCRCFRWCWCCRWCNCCICFMCFRCCWCYWCCRWCSCCISFRCIRCCYWCRWCSKSFRCYRFRCYWYFWWGG